MASSVLDTLKKRGRGRPSTGGQMPGVMVRMRPADFTALDTWIAAQSDPKPSRPEAIRRLLELGLQQEFERDTGNGLDTGAGELTRNIKALKDRLAEIPVHTDASSQAGMDTMRKALAQNDLTKLKNRRTRIARRGNRTGD